jgi:3-hydroxyacyl-CoA dehydrogenase
MDFSQMGKLMDLARKIDVDRVTQLADKVDVGALIGAVSRMDDAQLADLTDMIQGVGGHAASTMPRPFRSAAVLGAGTMGAQIAAHLANAGLRVELLDIAAKEGPKNALVEKQFAAAQKLNPNPFFTGEVARRIRPGNFDDHFNRIADVDWVIEVVVERLDIKQQLMARVEQTAREDAVLSTNTSGLRIADIASGRGESFRRRFLGTHFFNPPRYLKLLELIPTTDTDPEVIERVAQFGRLRLGKGIVVARDTPNFIGNRIGVYGMMQAIRAFTDGDYTIEEIDTLTGPLTGRPKSATFRTADVVGLDVLKHVAENLYENVPEDESREAFRTPEVLDRLVEKGALGAKTKAGFYRKEGKEIRSIDPASGEYVAPSETTGVDVEAIRKAGGLDERLRSLFDDQGRAGQFVRDTTTDLLAYSARRIPEITDNPADIDRAMRWGFGWEKGPFEIWDAVGFERVRAQAREADAALPKWVDEMARAGHDRFYRVEAGRRQVYIPSAGAYRDDPEPHDVIRLAAIKTDSRRELWKNDEAALLDMGEGVALYEFRSKANTLGSAVIGGLMECIERVENDPDLRGMVIGNDGSHFSVGANLAEAASAAEEGRTDVIEGFVRNFQQAMQRVRYSEKPVVVAVHQRALGGGCEVAMASPNPVAAAESYLGLVELGVGLIPAGTGTTRLAALASRNAANSFHSNVQPFVERYFENVAMARVATSAHQAVEMGYLAPTARIVMHEDRRLFVAREEVLRLSNQGYAPPPVESHIHVLGRPTQAAIEVALHQYLAGGFISEYDFFLGSQLAYVLTGGDLSYPQEVHEDYLIDLEREVFMRLLGEKKTQDRIAHILKHNKPLRN